MTLFHIYAFGSLCRGEVSETSDVDLLAAVTGPRNKLSRNMFSIYSHKRLAEIWAEGNPFAWHLYLEAKLIYSSDGHDFLASLRTPSPYLAADIDCLKFLNIFASARSSLNTSRAAVVFDLSTVFLAVRNFATCFLLSSGRPDFSRNSALNLMPSLAPQELTGYRICERARILCTRGFGKALQPCELDVAVSTLPAFEERMTQLYGRVARC